MSPDACLLPPPRLKASPAQLDVLYALREFQNAEKVALVLHRSHRAVRGHLERLRDRNECGTFELGYRLGYWDGYDQLELWPVAA